MQSLTGLTGLSGMSGLVGGGEGRPDTPQDFAWDENSALTTATFTFSSVEGATGYELHVRKAGEQWKGARVYLLADDVTEGTATDLDPLADWQARLRARRAGADSSPWTEAVDFDTYAGPHAYFDFRDFSTLNQAANGSVPVTAAGQPVARVVPKAGDNPPNFTSSGTERPLSGADGLVFDGTNDVLFSADSTFWKLINDGSNWTLLMAVKITDANPATQYQLLDNTGSTTVETGFAFIYRDNVNNNELFIEVTRSSAGTRFLQLIVADALPTQAMHVIAYRHTADATGNDLILRRDGALLGGSEPLEEPDDANPTRTLAVGRNSGVTVVRPLKGTVAALLVYGGSLSDDDLAIVEAALAG